MINSIIKHSQTNAGKGNQNIHTGSEKATLNAIIITFQAPHSTMVRGHFQTKSSTI
jgi:hypothetical protein